MAQQHAEVVARVAHTAYEPIVRRTFLVATAAAASAAAATAATTAAATGRRETDLGQQDVDQEVGRLAQSRCDEEELCVCVCVHGHITRTAVAVVSHSVE